MPSDPEVTNANQINTDGGAIVDGTVNTTGGDFVGRDQTLYGDQVGRDKISGAGDIHIHNYPATSPPTPTDDDIAPAPGDPPYQGMAYYDVADANRFFGREALTAELVGYLRQQPLLAVVGASGSGKSSLVRAGVMPALQGKMPLADGKQPPSSSPRWVYPPIITPTAHPLKTLAAALIPVNESILAQAQLMDALLVEPRSLDLYAHRLVKGDQRLLLVVDQFEELFTLCKDEREQGAFVDNLLAAATSDGVVTLVLTLRADFYHHCARFPALRTALENQQKYIGAMSRDELRRAIEEPAKAGQWEFQAGLVEQLLQDVGNEPGALPLLSHALLETWQRRRGRTLTLAGYRAAGGVQGAIAKTADDVFNRFTDEQKTIARIIFLRLTELGEGVQDTRRRVRPDELKLTHAGAAAVQQVLKTLADARLVATDDDEIQVAHEALIRNWETLREWLDDDREGNRIQRRLTKAANQWIEFGKDANLLYRGVLLQQTQEWLQNTIYPPNQIEMKFLQASQTETEAQATRALEQAQALAEAQQRRTQTFRWAALIATTLMVLALIATGIAINNVIEVRKQRDRANQQATIAFSRQLAAQAMSAFSKNDDELALLLAIASGKEIDTVEAFAAIREVLDRPWHSQALFYHKDFVSQVQWSRNGARFLTNTEDGAIHLWDAKNRALVVTFAGHTARVTQMTWSADERRLLTLSEDGTVRLWNTMDGQSIRQLSNPAFMIQQMIWSKNEKRVLTSSDDGVVRIWDVTTGDILRQMGKQTGTIIQLSWHADESSVLTSNDSGDAYLWDAETDKEIAHFPGGYYAEWSPDQNKILTYSGDSSGAVRIWDVAKNRLEQELRETSWATWSRNGKKLLMGHRVTGHRDDTQVIVRDAETYQVLAALDNYPGAAGTVVWSQTKNQLLVGNYSGPSYLLDTQTGADVLLQQSEAMILDQVAWNSDESKFLAYGVDSARVWDVKTGEVLVQLMNVSSVQWSPDSTRLLTNDATDSLARIWALSRGTEALLLAGFRSATWSSAEDKILTRSHDDKIQIWDATGKEIVKLDSEPGQINRAEWNKGESHLWTSGLDQIVRIWDVRSPGYPAQEVLRLDGFTWAAWNSDGNQVVAGGAEGGVLEIWALTNRNTLVTQLAGHPARVRQVAWSKDSSKILTTGYDQQNDANRCSTQLWDAVTGAELTKLDGWCTVKWTQNLDRIVNISDHDTAQIWAADTNDTVTEINGIESARWSQDGSKLLTGNRDRSIAIWWIQGAQAVPVTKLRGHTSLVWEALWNADESKVISYSADRTVRLWDVKQGVELARFDITVGRFDTLLLSADESKLLTVIKDIASVWEIATGKLVMQLEGIQSATWSKDGRRLLTVDNNGTIRIRYVDRQDLLTAACQWVPRNFTWREWSDYLKREKETYRPTCPDAVIPPDVIDGIQEEVRQQIRANQIDSATQHIEELNGWLQVSGQFKDYRVDVNALIAEVSATATAEALPSSTVTPTLSVTPARN